MISKISDQRLDGTEGKGERRKENARYNHAEKDGASRWWPMCPDWEGTSYASQKFPRAGTPDGEFSSCPSVGAADIKLVCSVSTLSFAVGLQLQMNE